MGHRASDFSSLGQLVLMPMGFIYRDLAVRGHSLFGELFRQAAVFPESQQRFIQQVTLNSNHCLKNIDSAPCYNYRTRR